MFCGSKIRPFYDSLMLPPPPHYCPPLPHSPPQADRECLEHIVYDLNDTDMMNALRPSIEEAQPVHTQELALDYIGRAGIMG